MVQAKREREGPEHKRVVSAARTDDGPKDAATETEASRTREDSEALTAICFDVSGSMRLDGKYGALKRELLKEVSATDNAKFLILAFSDTIVSLSADGVPMDKESAIAAIEARLPEPHGGTAIYKAVADMGGYIKKAITGFASGISQELLILKIFTDGDDNESTDEDTMNASEVVNDIRGNGGVVTLLQAGTSTLCADALNLDENAVLYFSDQGSTLANAALAAREASVTYRHAVLSREPTMPVLPAFSYTPLQRAMSVDPAHRSDTISAPSVPHVARR